MKYEKCPKCNKKGYHEDMSRDPLDNCITASFQYKCRYCNFHERHKERLKRTRRSGTMKTYSTNKRNPYGIGLFSSEEEALLRRYELVSSGKFTYDDINPRRIKKEVYVLDILEKEDSDLP